MWVVEGVWVVEEGVWVIEIDLCIRHMLYTWQYHTVYTIHTVHTVYVYHTYCTNVYTVHTERTYLSSDSGKLVAPMMMTPSSSL